MKKRWFERDPCALEQLERTLRTYYPTLHAFVDERTVVVRGGYSIFHEGSKIDQYSLEIHLPDGYPHSLPSVWETANRIPRDIDRHVFPASGALCLGVCEELWITLRGDCSIRPFLDGPVRNYLIGNSLLEAGDPWPYGERAHGAEGVVDSYSRYIGVSDPSTLLKFMCDLLKDKVRGHWLCPCGSGTIIRKCHREAIEQLRQTPKAAILNSGAHVLEQLERQRESLPSTS